MSWLVTMPVRLALWVLLAAVKSLIAMVIMILVWAGFAAGLGRWAGLW